MVWPLPRRRIADFCRRVKKVIVVEELDPFLETEIRAMGIKVWHGKDLVPSIGELTPAILEASLTKAVTGRKYRPAKPRAQTAELPGRPPNFCAGCGHRPLFYALKKLGVFVFGDIGCYTLSVAPPLSAMHASTCMGASVGGAYGAGKVLGREGLGKVCAVLGDSTFLHGGVAPLMDAVYNQGYSTTLILDNRITAMTGQQDHPGTGRTIRGDEAPMVDYAGLARAVGVRHVRHVDPYNIAETLAVLREELERDDASVIITRDSPCILLRRERPRDRFPHPLYRVNEETCRGCRACLNVACPAISWRPEPGMTAEGQKRKGTALINPEQCVGCGVCGQVCTFGSIVPKES
jgi:indolepyruvate ferredoxin oxidoreductase alpha subunit